LPCRALLTPTASNVRASHVHGLARALHRRRFQRRLS
jgi:hypothetical protein